MASITVYSKPGCVQCRAVKKFFDKKGVEYTVIDISKDDEAQQYLIDNNFKAMPVVDMGNGSILSGFRPDALSEQLKSMEAVVA